MLAGPSSGGPVSSVLEGAQVGWGGAKAGWSGGPMPSSLLLIFPEGPGPLPRAGARARCPIARPRDLFSCPGGTLPLSLGPEKGKTIFQAPPRARPCVRGFPHSGSEGQWPVWSQGPGAVGFLS